MTAPTTYQVRVWALKQAKGRRRPWGVRWVTARKEHSEWFRTKALAESYRSDLIKAQRVGEPFDVETGLPTSLMRRERARTLFEVAESYVDQLWEAGAPPNTRRSAVMHLSVGGSAAVRAAS